MGKLRKFKSKIKKVSRKYRKKLSHDYITTSMYFLRIILAIVVMILLLNQKTFQALIFFILSLGIRFIYRRHNNSQMDSLLNSTGDKCLISLSAIALFITGILPLWALVAFLARDVLFILRGLLALRKNKYINFKQSAFTKFTLLLQSVAIIAILLDKIDLILVTAAVVFTVLDIFVTFFSPEFQFSRKRIVDEFAFRKLLKLADFVTLANVFLGMLCIILAIIGSMTAAGIVLLLAVVTDIVDGRIARYTKTQSEFGKQLDSLADTVSFGVAPTVIGFLQLQTPLAILAFSFFLLCGVLRLAKFNIMEENNSFIGMPITVNGIIIPVIYFLNTPAMYYPYIYLALGLAMIAPVKLKKL